MKTNRNLFDKISKTKDGDIELERLIEMFEEIVDVRDSSGKRHCLTHIKDNALENLSILRKICYNIIKLDNRYDKVNKNGNIVKLSTKRKRNRYINYPKEFEELLFKVIPQIF